MSTAPKVKCSCGKVLGSKYEYYYEQVYKAKVAKNIDVDRTQYLSKKSSSTKSVEGEVLDEMRILKYCCRREMLTAVKMESLNYF